MRLCDNKIQINHNSFIKPKYELIDLLEIYQTPNIPFVTQVLTTNHQIINEKLSPLSIHIIENKKNRHNQMTD